MSRSFSVLHPMNVTDGSVEGVTVPTTNTYLATVSNKASLHRKLIPICVISSFGLEDTGNCPESEYTSKS